MLVCMRVFSCAHYIFRLTVLYIPRYTFVSEGFGGLHLLKSPEMNSSACVLIHSISYLRVNHVFWPIGDRLLANKYCIVIISTRGTIRLRSTGPIDYSKSTYDIDSFGKKKKKTEQNEKK